MHVIALIIAFIIAAYYIGYILPKKGNSEPTPKQTLQRGSQIIGIIALIGVILFLLVTIIYISQR